MSNSKLDFSTVFYRLRNIHKTLVITVNAAQIKLKSHSSQTLIRPNF